MGDVTDDRESAVSLGQSECEDDVEVFFDQTWYAHHPLSHSESYADCLHPAVTSVASSSRRVARPRDVPVATPLRLATDDNTCHHRSSYAECAHCKGKQRTNQSDSSMMWMLDSGASMHFTYSIDDFADFHYYKSRRPLHTADGITYMTGEGTVLVPLETGSTLKLTSVALVPNLTNKLISLGALLQDGLEARASTTDISFFRNDKLVVAFKPRNLGDTIYVTYSQPKSTRTLVTALEAVDYDTLHRRFAHPSRDVLKHARKHTEKCPPVEFPKKDSICRGCAEGKMPSQSHPLDTRRATRPFEIIHTDLKEFPIPSYHKYKYEILYYDDYTSYAWTIGLRTKDAALHVTRQWLTYIENQFGAKVQKWKSDSGGELKSTAFTNMLKDRGIEIITSAPHIHQQNGRAERIIRTLMDKGEAMRFDACIPQSWWEFSFEHAAHVYNRTPMKRLNWRTPYELLHGSKPDISHLRVFGCGAYVYLPPEVRKNKLSPKSELMIYLGVGAGGHNHKFMRSPNNVIFTAAQAVFDEHLFPKCPGHDTKRQRQHSAP